VIVLNAVWRADPAANRKRIREAVKEKRLHLVEPPTEVEESL
jgi:hypothetical protein